MTTFDDLNVATATLFDEPEQCDTTNSAPSQAPLQRTPFASLIAEAQNYPSPTPEELAESDRIFASSMEAYEKKGAILHAREQRHSLLKEYVAPHLVDLSKPAPIVKPIIEQNDIMIASLGNISAKSAQ